jgi:hypothetical protein
MSFHLWKLEVALMLILQVYNRKHKELENQHKGNIQEKKWRKAKSVVNTVQSTNLARKYYSYNALL